MTSAKNELLAIFAEGKAKAGERKASKPKEQNEFVLCQKKSTRSFSVFGPSNETTMEKAKRYFGEWEAERDPSKHNHKIETSSESISDMDCTSVPVKDIEPKMRIQNSEDWISRVMKIGFGIKF